MRILRTAIFAIMSAISIAGAAQAKKPTIMVIPTEAWCIENGYFTEDDSRGRPQKIVDYERAIQENGSLLNVVTKIGELMATQNFPLKDMAAEIRNINRAVAEDEMLQSSTSGSSLAETPLERLARRAKADILVEVGWNIRATGPKKAVTYTLRGLDAYTNKQVAATQGTGAPSMSAPDELLLEDAVVGRMDNFIAQLQNHFDDMVENGREITVRVQVFDNDSGLSLESEFGGEELTDIIDTWMNDNTVKHRYSLTDAGETSLFFEQVRIPLYGSNGSPMDTRRFVTQLRRFLAAQPYGITSKIITKGLGQANLILGEK